MKILVSNIDCNLSNINDRELINSVNEFIDAGNIFILVTDKSINYIADSLALIDINIDYYICNEGAVIFDRFFNVLYRKDVKSEVVRDIVSMLDSEDNILETFIDTSHGFVKDTYSCANGIVARPYDNVKAEMILSKIVLKYPCVHGKINDDLLNIFDSSVNKYNALKYLEETYRFNKEDIYVYATDISDIELMNEYQCFTNNSIEDMEKYTNLKFEDLKQVIGHLMCKE